MIAHTEQQGTDARSAGRDDALTFLNALFARRPTPSVIVVSQLNGNGRGLTSRFPLTTEDAAAMVVGAVDPYVRITLIEHKLDRSSRGKAADSIALPGVWVEIDVNGTPDGRGGVKTGACPTFEDAETLAHCVLEPTLLIASGGGLHAYHLFGEPLLLLTDEDHERAARLVEGWQARIKREAQERFGATVDSTADLARVLRPPGSFNGKGPEPRPVVLLDDGGRRYTIEEIKAEIVTVERKRPATARTDSGAGRAAAELCERFSDLDRLMRHKGTKPGDGSGHSWDYALGCRAAEHYCTDTEIAALIVEARRLHPDPNGKGEREDYIERTIAAVRRVVGQPDAEGAELLAGLSKELHADQVELELVDVELSGYGDSARVSFSFSDGSVCDFQRLEHVANNTRLGDVLAATVGIAAEFSKLQARRIASSVRRYAGRSGEGREHEQATNWGLDFLQIAQDRPFDFTDTASRFETWEKLTSHDPAQVVIHDRQGQDRVVSVQGADAYARQCVVATDRATQRRYVRASWFQEYVRRTGSRDRPEVVAGLMVTAEVGWERTGKEGRIKATGPDRTIPASFYIVPNGWETGVETDE